MGRYEPEAVRRDLLYLRKGPGYSDQRLAGRPALVQILGGPAEPTGVLAERFTSAIGSLHDADAELLTDIYRLSDETQDLADLGARRDYAGARLGLGREAVADRDAAAIERLLAQLITGWYPKSPTGIRIPESHNGFVHHVVSVVTVVRDGRHLETQHHYRLFALFDDVQTFRIATAHDTPPVSIGTEFTLESEAVANGYLHHFHRAEPMKRGQTYDLRYRVINPHPEEPEYLTMETIAFHEPTRFAVFETIFLGEQPQHVWRVQGLTGIEQPGDPTKANLIDMSSGTTAKAEFHDLYGGLFHGIAWTWPGD